MKMKVLGIRFCSVTSEAEPLARFLDSIGLVRQKPGGCGTDAVSFPGAVFPAGESWIEVWQENAEMPAGIMLQIIVDDADAFAEQAKANGLSPQGPVDEHGERIYFLQAPSGLPLSFQSSVE